MIEIKNTKNVDLDTNSLDPFWNVGDEKELRMHRIHALTSSQDYLASIEKQSVVKELMKTIDQFVYKLYDLTPEEIAVVEGV